MLNILLAFFSVFIMVTPVFSADIQYIDGPTGVTVKLNSDGIIKSFVASGEAELIYDNKKEERIATQDATFRAKIDISKFVKERLSSEEVMDNLTKIVSQATADGKNRLVSSANRELLETQRTIIKNNSNAILKGLVVLATDTNWDKKYVRVVVGTDEKLMPSADNLKGGQGK